MKKKKNKQSMFVFCFATDKYIKEFDPTKDLKNLKGVHITFNLKNQMNYKKEKLEKLSFKILQKLIKRLYGKKEN